MKSWALMLSIALVAVGCGKNETPQSAAAASCEGVSCKVGVDETKAGEAYAKFKFQKIGTCADNTLAFSWLMLSDRIVIANTIEKGDIVADLQILLNDDGSFTGVYQEKTQVRGEMGFWKTIETKNKKDLAGRWGTQKSQVMIDVIGLGDAVTAHGWPGIQFKASPELATLPSLAGRELNLIVTRSKVSPSGQTAEQACAEEKAEAEKKAAAAAAATKEAQ